MLKYEPAYSRGVKVALAEFQAGKLEISPAKFLDR